FLTAHRLLPALKPATNAYVALVGTTMAEAAKSIGRLRQAGLNLAVDISGRKLGDQLKVADKKGLQWVVIIGEDELKSGRYGLKNLKSGQQRELDADDLVKQIGEHS
ncbi:MAG: His/Gly/Thr/Pro-type tRNA ligase C-terminal domain-containing protein, partial [Candidatus Saccharimonadales bacterium]